MATEAFFEIPLEGRRRSTHPSRQEPDTTSDATEETKETDEILLSSEDENFETLDPPLKIWLNSIGAVNLHSKLNTSLNCHTIDDLIELVSDEQKYASLLADIGEMDDLTDKQRWDFSRACAKLKAKDVPRNLLEIAKYYQKFESTINHLQHVVHDIDQHTSTSKEVIDGMIDQCIDKLNEKRNRMRAKLDQIAGIKKNVVLDTKFHIGEKIEEARICLENSFNEVNSARALSTDSKEHINLLEQSFRGVDTSITVQAQIEHLNVNTDSVLESIEQLQIPTSDLDSLIQPRHRDTVMNLFASEWSGRYKARGVKLDDDTHQLCKVDAWGGYIRTRALLDKHGISAWNVQFMRTNRVEEPHGDCFLGIISEDWKDYRHNPREVDQFMIKSDGVNVLFGAQGWMEEPHALFNAEAIFDFLWRVEFDADEGYLTFYRVDRSKKKNKKERVFETFTRRYDVRVPDVRSRSRWAPGVRLFGAGIACSISFEEY